MPPNPTDEQNSEGAFGWLLKTIDGAKARLSVRLPVISRAVTIGLRAEIIDRAAALALFSMLAAVPALLGAFSAAGFLLGKFDDMAQIAGYEVASEPIMKKLIAFVQQLLPGVTWDPAALAHQLVEHRAENGVYGTVAAVTLGLGVFARLDAAIRVTLGRKRRSAWRAAGSMSLVFIFMGLLAALLVFAAPLTQWWMTTTQVKVAAFSEDLSAWLPSLFAAGQALPIAIGFFIIVRWSAGSRRLGKRRIAVAAVLYALLWFLGQRAFTLYVAEVIAMNAIYGTLTGVLALMLWLYYAAIAFLAVVAMLAAYVANRDGLLPDDRPL